MRLLSSSLTALMLGVPFFAAPALADASNPTPSQCAELNAWRDAHPNDPVRPGEFECVKADLDAAKAEATAQRDEYAKQIREMDRNAAKLPGN